MTIKHPKPTTALDYIASKTIVNGSCLEWVGKVNNSGYASINKTKWHRQYGTSMAHQLAYVLCYGRYDKSLNVCHSCNNRKCCQATHLYTASQRENLQYRKLCGTYTHGERHGGCKLNEEKVLEIRKRLADGESGRYLATVFGVSEATISEIKTKRKWSHI